MVQYQFQHPLVQASGRIRGEITAKLVADFEVRIGPAILKRTTVFRTERELCAGNDGLKIVFVKNETPVRWWISTDRKSAGVLSGAELRPKDLQIAGSDSEWMDPLELFMRAQEFAAADQGRRVRRLQIPVHHRFFEVEAVFHAGDPASSKPDECRVELAGLRFGDRVIDLSRKGLWFCGGLPGGFPEEIRVSGLEPFNLIVRGQVV